jgi:hypothetical protein
MNVVGVTKVQINRAASFRRSVSVLGRCIEARAVLYVPLIPRDDVADVAIFHLADFLQFINPHKSYRVHTSLEGPVSTRLNVQHSHQCHKLRFHGARQIRKQFRTPSPSNMRPTE